MNAHHMIPKMVQVLQLHPLLALGMLAEHQILTLQPLHFLQMLTVEVVVHHGNSTVGERPFLVGQPLVSNTVRALRLPY